MRPHFSDEQPAAKQSKELYPFFVQTARPYIFEQRIQECMESTGISEQRETNLRLQGVTWIDNVRKSLCLPARTFDTACIYYHKFRLVHSENEYDYRDAAAAALLCACKIEDTLKKSKDILCAAWNMNRFSEPASPDDPMFQVSSKVVIGLERLMLESSGFDFRNRYPQRMLLKLIKSRGLDRDTVGLTAYKMSLDLYRTFAPLKHTTQSMCLAVLELSARLCDVDPGPVRADQGFNHESWASSRIEVMENLLDLLDLYVNHRNATIIGPSYSLDLFIKIRISLNQESSRFSIPRYTQWIERSPISTTNTERSVRGHTTGAARSHRSGSVERTPRSTSPQSNATITPSTMERSKEGTVRFMLNPEMARDEQRIVQEYSEIEEFEEYVQ